MRQIVRCSHGCGVNRKSDVYSYDVIPPQVCEVAQSSVSSQVQSYSVEFEQVELAVGC